MHESVLDAFYEFNVKFEGDIPYFYQDVLGLVSIGVGILCDPIQLALGLNLPMVHPDGTSATRNDIAAEWAKIKSLGSGDHTQGNPAARGGHLYAKPHTRLRLTNEGLRYSLETKLVQMEGVLKKRFDAWETWPADAQMAILSLAWGCGPAFRFPKLEAALKELDFKTASTEVRMVANGVELYGLKPRNAANKVLLQNAAIALNTFDPKTLFYPTDLESSPVGPDDPTQPAMAPVVDFPIVHPEVPLPDNEPDPEAA